MTTPPTPRRIDVERCRKALLDPERISTHYAECEYSHVRCALSLALAELEAARAVVEAARPWKNTDLIGPLSKLAHSVAAYDRAIAGDTP